jgi:plastocyanin
MRTLLLALVIALVAVTPAAAATKNVKVGDDYFVKSGKPVTVTVTKGTTVKWNWKGASDHNVVARKGHKKVFQSAVKQRGSFKRKLKTRGTYKIICSIHAPDMRMTLRVT